MLTPAKPTPKKQKKSRLEEIKLKPVEGSYLCKYSTIENKLAILYKNQEKILEAIKLLSK